MLWTEVSGEPLLNNRWRVLKRSGSWDTSVLMKEDIPLQYQVIHVVAVIGSAAHEWVWSHTRQSASPNINSHHRVRWTVDDDSIAKSVQF